jgi:hypothetical protein
MARLWDTSYEETMDAEEIKMWNGAHLTTGPVEFKSLEIWGMSGMNDPATKTVTQSSDDENKW